MKGADCKAFSLIFDPDTNELIGMEEVEMEEYDVDELIYYLICGGEITGYINGEPAGVLNVKDGYANFFVGYDGCIFDIDVPREDFGPDTVLYKGKTIRELLDEDIFYDVNVY